MLDTLAETLAAAEVLKLKQGLAPTFSPGKLMFRTFGANTQTKYRYAEKHVNELRHFPTLARKQT